MKTCKLSAMESITSNENWTPPQWAVLERDVINRLNKAAIEFVERYTREDGTLIWRTEWPGMDGSDDPYEGFMNLALLYVLGGSKEVYLLSRKVWEAITWQWTEYGQVHREFDAYYDWMHHGEGNLFFYFLGLCENNSLKDRQRAVRFAKFYTGEDKDVPNYDKEKKLIRSPITGSKGPRFITTEEDWCTHRGILDDYLAPFEDLANVDFNSLKCQWSNDDIFKEILEKMNQRMNKGDIPLNLNATSLVTHAYMYTANETYKNWVLDYLKAWEERTKQNGGIIPDNIGLSGKIGEYNEGKWWGGYYGWRWPHGFATIIEPIVNACMNTVLLSGDMTMLDLARRQLDLNWEMGVEKDHLWLVPNRHFDSGWNDFRLPNPIYPIYLWLTSMKEEDLNRVQRINRDHDWNQVFIPTISGGDKKTGRQTKHYIANTLPWFQYIQGENPDYPENILKANMGLIDIQLEKMRSSKGDPNTWAEDNYNDGDFSHIHIWQEMCPVYFEGLLQLTLGAPMHISHGGLQHGRVRYYDLKEKRPGLPQDVSALVEKITDGSVTLTLVNLNRHEERATIIQAGTFGEHSFTVATYYNPQDIKVGEKEINGKWVEINLAPGSGLKLVLRLKRYVHTPSYQMPWDGNKELYIEGRKIDS